MMFLTGVARDGIPPLLTPDAEGRVPETGPWAVDNGCYSNPQGYSDERYLRFLSRRDPARCLFATAPDVWGDAQATLARSLPMLERIAALGYPPALCGQDGMTADMVPWDDIAALFLGGSDAFRSSAACAELVRVARAHGKWVHMGRVNSWKRIEFARSLGCHSVDGTILRFDPNRPVAEWVERASREPHVWPDTT